MFLPLKFAAVNLLTPKAPNQLLLFQSLLLPRHCFLLIVLIHGRVQEFQLLWVIFSMIFTLVRGGSTVAHRYHVIVLTLRAGWRWLDALQLGLSCCGIRAVVISNVAA